MSRVLGRKITWLRSDLLSLFLFLSLYKASALLLPGEGDLLQNVSCVSLSQNGHFVALFEVHSVTSSEFVLKVYCSNIICR